MLSRMNNRRKLKEYLKQEIDSFPQVFENSPDIFLIIIDLRGVIVQARGINNRIVGRKYKEFIHKEDLDRIEGCFKEIQKGFFRYTDFRTFDNGEIKYIDATLVPIKDENEVIGVYGLARNVSDKQELKHGIKQTKERLQSLLYYSQEMIGIFDAEGKIIFQSPSIESSLGYKVEEFTGENYFNLIHSDDLSMTEKQFAKIINEPNSQFTLEVRLKHKNGDWRTYEVVCTNLLNNKSVKGIVCNFHDITELKKQHLEIQYMAHHDYLTELPNRRAFEERLELELRLANIDNRKFAILFLNLDGFKYLNDSLGHDIGDLLLIEIARKLKNNLNGYAEMVARIGGDEFAILTTSFSDIHTVEEIANDVLAVFEESFKIKDYNLFITTSIGISVYPDTSNDSGLLMKKANLALYLAEKSGNNNYQIFSPTADIGTYKLFSLRNSMKKALYENQFLVYYQPIVHAETNQIVSVEALLRWDHPEWGIVPPNEFIPLAEESGLIIPIGEWVLQSVCKNVRSWHAAGYYIQASVNLSLVQFLQADLIDVITRVLQENELDPKWLNVEITESAVIEQEEEFMKKINQIRSLGMQISLDDFGTGYSSFSKLKDIRPDVLKLDRSIIKDIPTNLESTEIVTSMINLAHRLSLIVVAEGVETVEQQKFLIDLDCDYIQGYLFSRPVSEENIVKLFEGQFDSEKEIRPAEDRRKYFRIDFQYPLEALMTVSELNGKKVRLGNTKILLEDIGPGGLCFLSNIHLPSRSDIILKFQTTIMNEEMTLYGTIVHDSEQGDLYRYGVKFIIDEQPREHLIKHLNHFQLHLRKDPLLLGHPFVTGNVMSYF